MVFKLLKKDLFILKRESMCTQEWDEGEKESQADSVLSVEPNMGLIPGP